MQNVTHGHKKLQKLEQKNQKKLFNLFQTALSSLEVPDMMDDT